MPASVHLPVGLLHALSEVGLSTVRVLAAAGLPLDLFDVARPVLERDAYFRLWEGIGRVARRPSIGLELAATVQPDLMEPLFLAMLGAFDVRGALEVLCQYKRALSPEIVELRARGHHVHVVKQWPEAVVAPPVLVDCELAVLVGVLRRGLRDAQFAPVEVHLRSDRRKGMTARRRWFGCPVTVGADEDAVVLRKEDLARRLATFNPVVQSALLPPLASAANDGDTLIARASDAVARNLSGGGPTLRAVSRTLALSARTLQRRLGEQGTSLRELVDNVRRARAHAYLASTAYSEAEVAFLLGFQDGSAFRRAFHRWHGVSPRTYRTQRARRVAG
jgi:AraC-like DNA-binding protein